MIILTGDDHGVVSNKIDPKRVDVHRCVSAPGHYVVSLGSETDIVCTLDELMEFACSVLSAQLRALQLNNEAAVAS